MSEGKSHPSGAGDSSEQLITEAETLIHEAERGISHVSQMTEEFPSLLGGEDVAELLERLASADMMAQGMESKLDNVLNNLDALLSTLEAEEERAEQEEESDACTGKAKDNHAEDV
ncbi:hypothetical protein NLJ89_g3609 [Agrocybe chaxingu]|uniref:Uncharacterized protein n=1 Tax=Agrocybe chaxingu TaxID=84603 RepID=A0A9W8MVB7_9AGAR|nr:hypothetical protein NLJ89_g3609 [Agrocybe chaxingu]